MASLAIPDELLVDIFLRLPTPEDLIRASAACVSFRRLVVDRSFLRRFRKIHPRPLLGFLDPHVHRFHPAVRPHPSAPAAGAVALAADFSFAFLPAPARDWTVREVRNGRVLLDRPRRHGADEWRFLFKEMVVCDPLHRQYLLLPPIPDDLAASVADQLLIDGQIFAETFLVPPGYDEEEAATATEEMSFRVIWMVLLQAKPMAVVFSSRTGQWRALTQSESLPGFVLSTSMVRFMSRHYAHGCFYWISGSSEKLLVLDIQRMEFSMADHPPCARASSDDVAIVEAGQGTIRMFVPTPHTARRSFTVWRNNGGSSTQWQMENETILLPSGSMLVGAVGRHLLLYHVGSSSIRRGCYTRGVDTFQFERVCDSGSLPKPSHVYCNFPPSLLSSPTVSSATPHADVRGEGGAVLVPELQESDPGGVEGPVLSAAAQAPNPLFVVNNEAEVSCGGRGEGGAGAGAGHAEGPGVGDVAGEGMEGDEGPAGTGVSRRTTAAKGNKSFRWRGCFHCWM